VVTTVSALMMGVGGLLMLVGIAVDFGSHQKVKAAMPIVLAGAIIIIVSAMVRFFGVVNWTGKITIAVLMGATVGAYLLGKRWR
jgi:hypothetical protein